LRKFITRRVQDIVTAVWNALRELPPEYAAAIVDRGITLTGGGALLSGLADHLGKSTSLAVSVPEDPSCAAVIGAAIALSDASLFRLALSPE